MRHGGKDRHVGARLHGQPQRGKVDQLHAARVDDDQLGAVIGTASFICSAMIGWVSAVLEPVTMKTSL